MPNKWFNRLARLASSPTAPGLEPKETAENQLSEAEANFRRALHSLSEQERQLAVAYRLGFSRGELARRFGLSRDELTKLLADIKRRLRGE
jgi:DNA-directed RNA polymerase specialized sigma24 family protein